MSDYRSGDVIELKGINLTLKIKGVYPAGQPMMVHMGEEKSYSVELAERQTLQLKESTLELLKSFVHVENPKKSVDDVENPKKSVDDVENPKKSVEDFVPAQKKETKEKISKGVK